jgi:hypothetical protein
MQLIMSNIPVSLFTVDTKGIVTYANDNKAMKVFNFSESIGSS